MHNADLELSYLGNTVLKLCQDIPYIFMSDAFVMLSLSFHLWKKRKRYKSQIYLQYSGA